MDKQPLEVLNDAFVKAEAKKKAQEQVAASEALIAETLANLPKGDSEQDIRQRESQVEGLLDLIGEGIEVASNAGDEATTGRLSTLLSKYESAMTTFRIDTKRDPSEVIKVFDTKIKDSNPGDEKDKPVKPDSGPIIAQTEGAPIVPPQPGDTPVSSSVPEKEAVNNSSLPEGADTKDQGKSREGSTNSKPKDANSREQAPESNEYGISHGGYKFAKEKARLFGDVLKRPKADKTAIATSAEKALADVKSGPIRFALAQELVKNGVINKEQLIEMEKRGFGVEDLKPRSNDQAKAETSKSGEGAEKKAQAEIFDPIKEAPDYLKNVAHFAPSQMNKELEYVLRRVSPEGRKVLSDKLVAEGVVKQEVIDNASKLIGVGILKTEDNKKSEASKKEKEVNPDYIKNKMALLKKFHDMAPSQLEGQINFVFRNSNPEEREALGKKLIEDGLVKQEVVEKVNRFIDLNAVKITKPESGEAGKSSRVETGKLKSRVKMSLSDPDVDEDYGERIRARKKMGKEEKVAKASKPKTATPTEPVTPPESNPIVSPEQPKVKEKPIFPTTLTVESMMNTAGFAEFLAQFPDAENVVESEADLKDRFETYRLKEIVTEKVNNWYGERIGSDLRQETSLAEKAGIANALDAYFNQLALTEVGPAQIREFMVQIGTLETLPQNIAGLQHILAGDFAQVPGMEGKTFDEQLVILKERQKNLVLARETNNNFALGSLQWLAAGYEKAINGLKWLGKKARGLDTDKNFIHSKLAEHDVTIERRANTINTERTKARGIVKNEYGINIGTLLSNSKELDQEIARIEKVLEKATALSLAKEQFAGLQDLILSSLSGVKEVHDIATQKVQDILGKVTESPTLENIDQFQDYFEYLKDDAGAVGEDVKRVDFAEAGMAIGGNEPKAEKNKSFNYLEQVLKPGYQLMVDSAVERRVYGLIRQATAETNLGGAAFTRLEMSLSEIAGRNKAGSLSGQAFADFVSKAFNTVINELKAKPEERAKVLVMKSVGAKIISKIRAGAQA